MPKVLIVDDLAIDRQVAAHWLQEDGQLEVGFAENGARALAEITETPPDLVLTDLVMPELDGLELVTRVKQQYPLIPVVLMTSQGSEETVLEALRRGAASYVTKRTLDRDLVATVRKVLAVSHGQRTRRRLMGSLVHNHRQFTLENDPVLFAPLVAHFQETLFEMGLCEESDLTRIGVALEEALVNALYHGNLEVSSDLRGEDDAAYHRLVRRRMAEPPYCRRRVFVEARFSPQQAVFVVGDEGPGFDPSALPDPTDPANLERASGRGLLLMRTFMDDVRYNESGNQVTLIKRAKRAHPRSG
ncbi:MAG TPA: response regulator [Planctomycetaceae bacterium]|nr:response regulator [Planctomycetaceae bacterium]HIQ21456.1 response regulator [Planctomycetota bacterium]